MINKKFLPVGILLLGIGFALVTTTILITGNVKIATNNADFGVVFTKATAAGEGASANISGDGKTITFGTKNLTTVGDVAKLDFEVTNNSEMYNAKVSVECSTTGTKSSYYQITTSGEMVIEGKAKRAGKVEVTLKKASVENINETFTCTLIATAAERTTKAYRPKYFAYESGNGLDIPTTASTQDYEILKYPGTETPAKVFVGLDSDGSQKSVCIIRNGSLECFRGGHTTAYVAEEQEHVKRVFGETNCSGDSSVTCSLGTFGCSVSSSGYVHCNDDSMHCYVRSNGSVDCS